MPLWCRSELEGRWRRWAVACGVGLVLAASVAAGDADRTGSRVAALTLTTPSSGVGPPQALQAEIAADIAQLESAYARAFPGLPAHELARGVAAIDADVARAQAEIEAFPPYEFLLEEGRTAFHAAFPDGAHYQDCFALAPAELRPRYPRFDPETGAVVTLEQALNHCRQAHGMTALAYGGAELNGLSAYLSFLARGHPLQAPGPDVPEAMQEYRHGREIFYRRQGQLELACADCHVRAVGKRLRDVRLGPAIGVAGRFPIYSLRTGTLGSLQGRFQGCYEVVRAQALPQQSRDYRALEYFLNVVSASYPVTGPGLLR